MRGPVSSIASPTRRVRKRGKLLQLEHRKDTLSAAGRNQNVTRAILSATCVFIASGASSTKTCLHAADRGSP